MAKTPKTAQAGDFQLIPWDKLTPSAKNVRKVPSDGDLEFTEDIARRGVLCSLLVRPQAGQDGVETGLFEVVAGGRRYRAVGRLVEQKRKPANSLVPCQIRRDGIAEDDSLAENVQRAPLHPLDQYRAFAALAENQLSEEDIAARFFVPVSVVRQRLKLVTVSPALLDAFGRDEMRLEQLMAFTVNGDHARQEQVWDAVAHSIHHNQPFQIRRLLTENTVKASDKRALFVGAESYLEAGGAITRDLFEVDDGGWFQDVGLLEHLLQEKLLAHAEEIKAEGWLWIEAALEHPYGHSFDMRRLSGTKADLSDEEKAELDELTARYDALTTQYDAAEELPDDVDQQCGELEERIEALQNRPDQYDPADVARGGVFVSVSPKGQLRIERGYVRPEDEQAPDPEPEVNGAREDGSASHGDGARSLSPDTDRSGTPTGEEDDGGDLKPLPERLLSELTAVRTVALRNALACEPAVAMTLLLHKLCCDQFYRGAEGELLNVHLVRTSLAYSGLSDFAPAQDIAQRNQTWLEALPDNEADLWDWLERLDDGNRFSLLAHCLSFGINALYQKADQYTSGPSARTIATRMRNANHLAQVVKLDLRARGWKPTVANYFGNVSKAHILRAVTEAKGGDTARRIKDLKKPDMAASAEALLAETAWLPDILRTPAPAAADIHSDQPSSDDGTAPAIEGTGNSRPDLEAAE